MDKIEVNKIYKKRFKELHWKYKHGLINQSELRQSLEELVYFCNDNGLFQGLGIEDIKNNT